MYNQITIIGRLTKDPEMKQLQKGGLAKISVATSRNFKNKDGEYESDFFDITCWQGIAEQVCRTCKKGTAVVIIGRLENNNYVNKDNQKVYQNEIIAERVVSMGNSSKVKDLGEEEIEEDKKE